MPIGLVYVFAIERKSNRNFFLSFCRNSSKPAWSIKTQSQHEYGHHFWFRNQATPNFWFTVDLRRFRKFKIMLQSQMPNVEHKLIKLVGACTWRPNPFVHASSPHLHIWLKPRVLERPVWGNVASVKVFHYPWRHSFTDSCTVRHNQCRNIPAIDAFFSIPEKRKAVAYVLAELYPSLCQFSRRPARVHESGLRHVLQVQLQVTLRQISGFS